MSDVRQLGNKRGPLFAAIKKDIVQKARDRKFPDGKLPSEEDLCLHYGVSRATIREALSILHREGFISKRHGKGNFLNYSAIDASMRFDLEISIPQMLRGSGKQVSVKRGKLNAVNNGMNLKNVLNVSEKIFPLLEQVTKHYIEKQTAVIAYNYFPYTEEHNKLQGENFKEVVVSVTGKELSHTIQSFVPIVLDQEMQREFNTDKSAGIMWHQKHYAPDDSLLCESYVFFNPQIVLLKSLTRWV